jgi:hypothetical protein
MGRNNVEEKDYGIGHPYFAPWGLTDRWVVSQGVALGFFIAPLSGLQTDHTLTGEPATFQTDRPSGFNRSPLTGSKLPPVRVDQGLKQTEPNPRGSAPFALLSLPATPAD